MKKYPPIPTLPEHQRDNPPAWYIEFLAKRDEYIREREAKRDAWLTRLAKVPPPANS